MPRLISLLSLLGLTILLAPGAAEAKILAHWSQYAGNGQVEERFVTDDISCPTGMTERASQSAAFPVRVCAEDGEEPAKLDRIVVIGDTGCRIKDMRAQACNDPKQWPFAEIAKRAAAEKPDLVIHVGDYHYRESPCPDDDDGCTGSPVGSTWKVWNADFFTPAAPLLAAAPWIMVRGNHEECDRAGEGWSRFVAPYAFGPAPCAEHEAPYSVKLGGIDFFVMDMAIPSDTSVDDKTAALYRAEFESLGKVAAAEPTWLLGHKPLWSVLLVKDGKAVGESKTLVAASGGHLPAALKLAISGHLHTFEGLQFEAPEPPQLVVGNSGTALDKPAPTELSGLMVGAQKIAHGFRDNGFGYFVFDRTGDGWEGRLVDPDGKIRAHCSFGSAGLDCKA